MNPTTTTIKSSNGFDLLRDEKDRLYFIIKSLDKEELFLLEDIVLDMADTISKSTLIFDYFSFEPPEEAKGLKEVRDALYHVGVKNLYRVGNMEKLCKLLYTIDFETPYNVYICFSYGELYNLLRMLDK